MEQRLRLIRPRDVIRGLFIGIGLILLFVFGSRALAQASNMELVRGRPMFERIASLPGQLFGISNPNAETASHLAPIAISTPATPNSHADVTATPQTTPPETSAMAAGTISTMASEGKAAGMSSTEAKAKQHPRNHTNVTDEIRVNQSISPQSTTTDSTDEQSAPVSS